MPARLRTDLTLCDADAVAEPTWRCARPARLQTDLALCDADAVADQPDAVRCRHVHVPPASAAPGTMATLHDASPDAATG